MKISPEVLLGILIGLLCSILIGNLASALFLLGPGPWSQHAVSSFLIAPVAASVIYLLLRRKRAGILAVEIVAPLLVIASLVLTVILIWRGEWHKTAAMIVPAVTAICIYRIVRNAGVRALFRNAVEGLEEWHDRGE